MTVQKGIECGKANVLVVDMQPCYDSECYHLLKESIAVMEMAANVKMFWVGDGLSDDTESSVAEYWLEAGASPQLIERIQFIEKGYGFLRDWMDSQVPYETIVKTLRYMVSRGIRNSRNLSKRELGALCRGESPLKGWSIQVPTHGGLYIPDYCIDDFKGRDWVTFGGASVACLPEIELLLNGHYIKTTRLDKLSWG